MNTLNLPTNVRLGLKSLNKDEHSGLTHIYQTWFKSLTKSTNIRLGSTVSPIMYTLDIPSNIRLGLKGFTKNTLALLTTIILGSKVSPNPQILDLAQKSRQRRRL